MADLLFGGFALMPGPVRKEKQFRLLDDFSKTYFNFSRGLAIPRPVFPRNSFDCCPEFTNCKIIYTSAKQRNFSTFLSEKEILPRCSHCYVSGGIKGFIRQTFEFRPGFLFLFFLIFVFLF